MKDFDLWNENKKEVQSYTNPTLFNEREVWWCVLGVNIGSEQDGKGSYFERPVLIIRKLDNDVLWALPLTHSNKNNKYYHLLTGVEEHSSAVVVSQIRLISSKRLLRKMFVVNKEDFIEIIDKIKKCLPSV